MCIKIEDFFNTDYVDAASYDNLRKISSYIDGLKNCSRKITYTLIGKNINTKTKLSRLQSTVSYETEYLHGEDGIAKVMVGMAQNFSGSNNIPLLQRNGNFVIDYLQLLQQVDIFIHRKKNTLKIYLGKMMMMF